jgi:hypothetical protein
MTAPKYPDVHVRLTGEDGNAFAVLDHVTRAMREAMVPRAEIDTFKAEAMSGDYDHLLQTRMAWVDVS